MTQRKHLTAKEIAAALGVSMQTLAEWRRTADNGFRYYKIGGLVLINPEDIDDFIAIDEAAHRDVGPDEDDEDEEEEDFEEDSDGDDDDNDDDEFDDGDE